MVTLREALAAVRTVHVPARSPEVCETIAMEVTAGLAPQARVQRRRMPARPREPALEIAVEASKAGSRPWVKLTARPRHRMRLVASEPAFLYAWFTELVGRHGDTAVGELPGGRVEPAFRWQRPVWDLYLAQAARSIRNLDPESYVRRMAAAGFTHLEANSLATPEGFEPCAPGEIYARFYTYCPALDQFVTSFLNRGVYPASYLRANLARLKRLCALATRYGLTPTMTCFEPRSVPDALLERYPELRGARVDHPFRSFRPRYNLAVSHPVVRRHYRELVQNLLREVPELGCLAIWSNDSGAGYEHTRSLYVGANGSAYLVREWQDAEIFARSAAANVVGFLELLRASAAEINPDLRVTTRLEPFGPEREGVLAGLRDGIDVETASLLTTGWETHYGHPRYRDWGIGDFTIFNDRFDPGERPAMRALGRRGIRTHVFHSHGPVNNFEPLLGIPSPWLTHAKLAALHEHGASYLAHLGGIAPPQSAPWSVNEEVFRRFQFDPTLDLDATLKEIARGWAGPGAAGALVRAWRSCDRAIRGYAPNPLYFLWGVWYRILVRPLVPDIEAIPLARRAYYERHLLATHHNPNRVDLRRDVMFDLMTPAQAAKAVRRIEAHALPPLEKAIGILERALTGTPDGAARGVLVDQRDRLRALRCWMVTGKNVSAWIAGVHGALDARGATERRAHRRDLRAMVREEITNAQEFLDLLRTTPCELLALAAGDETTFIYDERITDHLARKIELMSEFGDLPPRIDPDLMWRVAALEGGPPC